MKSIILVDLDGVVVDLVEDWCASYNEKYNDTMPTEEFGSSFGGIHDIVKPECGEKVYDLMYAPGFMAGLNPLPGAIEGFETLCKQPNREICVVSSFSGNEEMAHGKMVWLKNNLPFYDPEQTILTNKKMFVYGNVLIDDAFSNLSAWKQQMDSIDDAVHIPIMPDAAHNGDDDVESIGGYRTFNWDEIIQCVILACGI